MTTVRKTTVLISLNTVTGAGIDVSGGDEAPLVAAVTRNQILDSDLGRDILIDKTAPWSRITNSEVDGCRDWADSDAALPGRSSSTNGSRTVWTASWSSNPTTIG